MRERNDVAPSGTQSIERAVRVLKEITTRSKFGWRPSDLAARCQLDRGTTHRILNCLVRERLVRQRTGDRHYVPGPLLFELALTMPAYKAFQVASQPILGRIAKQLPGFVALCMRSGAETVCVASAGSPAYFGTSFDVGTRRSLVASAAGIAILLAVPRADAQAIATACLRHAGDGTGTDAADKAFRRMWTKSAAAGFAINQGVMARGINAVSVALRDEQAQPFGSVALAAGANELTPARFAEMAAMLNGEALALERAARRTLPDGVYNAWRD